MMRILTLSELLQELSKYSHKELHLHHTWKPAHSSFNGSNHIALQEGMKTYHVNTLGWSDIGQHVTLMPDGKFVTGRNFGVQPASIYGYNAGAFCCEMLGNFDVQGVLTSEYNSLGYDTLSGEQLASALGLAKYFDDKGKYVRFHNENSNKTCPGNGINKDEFMNSVKNYGKKYYVVTDYIPQGEYGIEINSLIIKYFFDVDRLYMRMNDKGMWIETQYLPKTVAEELGERLRIDNLLWEVVEE